MIILVYIMGTLITINATKFENIFSINGFLLVILYCLIVTVYPRTSNGYKTDSFYITAVKYHMYCEYVSWSLIGKLLFLLCAVIL